MARKNLKGSVKPRVTSGQKKSKKVVGKKPDKPNKAIKQKTKSSIKTDLKLNTKPKQKPKLKPKDKIAKKNADRARKAANTRKQIRVYVSIISILVLNLSLNVVNKFIKTQEGNLSAYWLTIIGMVLVLLVFYPAIAMKYYVNVVTGWVWKHTINLSTMVLQKRPAIITVFIISLLLLYFGFYYIWFGKFLFQEFF